MRAAADKLKVESGIKKANKNVGNFDLYDIDEQSLEATASSWSAKTHVARKQLGERYIKSRYNKIKGNLGQVAKESKECKGFKFTFKGKMKINQLGVSKVFFVGLVSLPIFLPRKLDMC